MNRILLLFFFIPFFALAQVPQGVGYQGVATDANGIELVNQSISIRASVLSGSATGTIEWEETHATSTDTFGLFTLTIGQGTNTTNGAQTSFADISWGTNTYFLKIEMDVTGGSTYSNMGTNQMMSVPYALYAENTNINYDSIATILSNDSSFTNSLGGSGSGGCNMKFPEGVNGEVIHEEITKYISYTVPSGKRLYITNWFSSSSYGYRINGDMAGYLPDVHPLKLNPGDVISCELVPANSGNQTILFSGLLIDVNPDVLVIHEEITKFISYTVPSGKRLYITNWFSSSSYGYKINGDMKGYLPSFHTIKLNPGDVISCELVPANSGNQTIIFSGYLVDENYFAGCGGGGSSSASSGLDSATVASMIASAISNSVSIGIGDYYGGGIVGYIFQPGDADYILGETHGYTLYFDNNGIEWGCNGVTTNVVNNNFGQGPNNTQILDSLCPESNFAAKWCNDLVIGPHNDWFLPTYEEAILIDLSFYLNLQNSFNNSSFQIWLSEEFAPNPNPYNYNCSSCSSASNAWTLRIISNTLDVGATLKINNQAGNVIAFRKF